MGLENILTENILVGMKKAFNNATSLLDEAYLLKTNNRLARAYALCQLSIEELAKIQILFELWIDRINNNIIDYKALNKSFTNHIVKTKTYLETAIAKFRLFKAQYSDDWIDKLITIYEERLKIVKDLNDLKKESLYVSIINNNFQSPAEKIDEEKFASIFTLAYLDKEFFEKFIEICENHMYEIAQNLKH